MGTGWNSPVWKRAAVYADSIRGVVRLPGQHAERGCSSRTTGAWVHRVPELLRKLPGSLPVPDAELRAAGGGIIWKRGTELAARTGFHELRSGDFASVRVL